MKYSLFIGRWQPWHKGHRWLIDERMKEGFNVCVAIRDVKKSDSNPFSPKEIKNNLEKELEELISKNRVKIIIIPDIESVNYGRGVGYDIIEHVPPRNIKEISATKIREELFNK
jgi:Nicotinamide mononucleotide adenylyltransferase